MFIFCINVHTFSSYNSSPPHSHSSSHPQFFPCLSACVNFPSLLFPFCVGFPLCYFPLSFVSETFLLILSLFILKICQFLFILLFVDVQFCSLSCSFQKSHLTCRQYQCVPWLLSVTLLILMVTVYSALLYDLRTAFCPHSVFMYVAWI